MKTHVYIASKRKQVSIEDDIIQRIAKRGYTLDSFLQYELNTMDKCQFSSKTIQYMARIKLDKLESTALKNDKYTFTFIDLFAGIGGFRLPLEREKGKCLGYSEIQWDSMRVYTDNFHMNEAYLGDIRDLQKIDFPEKLDMVIGGVPCQSWSSAGKNRGFDDERGRLWLDTLRVVKENNPQCFLFENVKGLADPRHKKALEYIISSFKKIGYHVTYKVLSSRDFGLVQDRERIFLVGFRNEKYLAKFQWPDPVSEYPSLGEVIKLPDFDDRKLTKKNKQMYIFPRDSDLNFASHNDHFNDYFIFSDVRTGNTTIHSWDFVELSSSEKQLCNYFPSLRRRLGKKLYGRDGAPLSIDDIRKDVTNLRDISEKDFASLVKKGIFKRFIGEENDKVRYDFTNSKQSTGIDGVYRVYSPNSISFPTITATGSPDFISLLPFQGDTQEEYNQYFIDYIFKQNQYRNLSDREVARLQGFPDDFRLCSQGNAKRQLGNAVSVSVIEELVRSIKNTQVFLKIK